MTIKLCISEARFQLIPLYRNFCFRRMKGSTLAALAGSSFDLVTRKALALRRNLFNYSIMRWCEVENKGGLPWSLSLEALVPPGLQACFPMWVRGNIERSGNPSGELWIGDRSNRSVIGSFVQCVELELIEVQSEIKIVDTMCSLIWVDPLFSFSFSSPRIMKKLQIRVTRVDVGVGFALVLSFVGDVGGRSNVHHGMGRFLRTGL